MTRNARTRSRTLRGSVSGSVVRTYPPNPIILPPQTTVVTSTELKKQYTSDYVGPPWVDTPFNSKMGVTPRISISGVRTASGLVYTSTDVPMLPGCQLLTREPWNYTAYFGRDPISAIALTQMALANMNPNRPDADLGVSILELRELPELLRDSTDILRRLEGKLPPNNIKRTAKAHVIASFGIQPIIRDLLTLMDFAKAVNRREKYLRELSSGFKRVKRKLTEEAWDGIAPSQTPWHPTVDEQTSTNKCTVSCHATRTYWFTARAKLQQALTEREIKNLSAAITYGLHTITAKQLWELVPWSWLLDWFATTGTILAAYRGGLKWQWEGLNIMYKTTYYMTMYFPNPRSGFTITPLNPNAKAVTKERVTPVLFGLPVWRMPYLTAGQWSILSSLAVLRIRT